MTDHNAAWPISRSTHVNGHCQCDLCRAETRRWMRDYRAVLRATAERDDLGHVVGQPVSASTYANFKCRCEGCGAAKAKAKRAYRAQRRELAT